jgi:hypothetical protein
VAWQLSGTPAATSLLQAPSEPRSCARNSDVFSIAPKPDMPRSTACCDVCCASRTDCCAFSTAPKSRSIPTRRKTTFVTKRKISGVTARDNGRDARRSRQDLRQAQTSFLRLHRSPTRHSRTLDPQSAGPSSGKRHLEPCPGICPGYTDLLSCWQRASSCSKVR